MKKYVPLLALLLVLPLAAVVAGGSKEKSSGTPAGKQKITHWTWLNMEPVAQEYAAKNPQVEIEIVKLGPWDLHDKLLVSLASGEGLPEVANLVIRRFPNYSSTGKMLDLTPYVKDVVANYEPGVVEALSYKGKVYGLPNDVSPSIFYYRKDIFDKLGIKVEDIKTFQDFRELGKKLKGSGYLLMPMFYPAGNWGANALNLFLHSMGGNLFTEDGKVKANNPELLATLKYFSDLYFVDKSIDGMKYFSTEFWAAFKADKYAAWIVNLPEGANIKKNMPELSGKWSLGRMPQWKSGSDSLLGVWGGSVAAVPAQAKNKEAAVGWIKWLDGSTEGQISQAKAWNAMPSFKPALQTEFFSKPDPYFGVRYLDYFSSMKITPYYYYDWAQTEQVVGNHIDKMFSGAEDYNAAHDGIIKDLKRELNR